MTKLLFKYQFLTIFLVCCASVAAQAVEAVPGEFIVRYKSNKNSITSLSKTSLNQNMRLRKSWDNINTHFFKTGSNNPSSRDDLETLKGLREDPNVLFAEPNYLVRAQQASYFPTNAPIRAPESWSSGITSANAVTVAVLDSGLDIEHTVFKNTGRLWNNQQEISGTPGVDDDGNGYVDDFHGWNFISNNNNLSDGSGHGTHVSGIVVSSTEDILNVSTSNQGDQRVQVMVLKFLDAEGVGTTSNAINAIYYAVNNGAKVLNNSWGGSGYSGALHEAIAYSFFENTVFVAAAGNSGTDNDQSPIFPANYDVPNVISVGASDDADSIAYFSNFGNSVHVSAPGVNVLSTAPGGDHDGYYSSSGTSMSTPFVAGLAALMVREAPHFSGFQLKRDILASAQAFSSLATASSSKARVNFQAAVNLASANSSEANFNPDYTPDYNYSSRELASLNEGEGGGFGCGRVKSLYKTQNEKIESGKIGIKHFFMTVILFMPFALIGFVRKRTSYQRKHERYRVDFKGSLYNSEGKKVDVKVCTFSLGGAGVKINFKKEAFEGKSNLVLRFTTRSGETKEYSCKAVSTYRNQIGLCFEQ
jgi:hypothetical protein